MKRLMVIMMVLAAAMAAQAQDYRFEAGGAVGMSSYLGEANGSSIFAHPGFAAGCLDI